MTPRRLRTFFDALGPQRSALLTHVSADGAEWIHAAVAERAPQAILGMDPFHVVAWATKALDEVRRGMWNDLRRSGKPARPRLERRPVGAGEEPRESHW